MTRNTCFIAILLALLSCKTEKSDEKAWRFVSANENYAAQGRIDIGTSGEPLLIGPASFVRFQVKSDSAVVHLKAVNSVSYVSLEIDGRHFGRINLDSLQNEIPVQFENSNSRHEIAIVKSTEANSGTITVLGLSATEVLPPEESSDRLKVEFIGNSITCGAAMDDSFLPCGEGDYSNYHHAYFSYGPRLARGLNADYLISAVSGFGIYRGWNSERNEQVNSIPEIYDNLYLDGDGSKTNNFKTFIPDIVSICLGTNDLSSGDGKKIREPFSKEIFTKSYIDFIYTILEKYPNVQVVLLNSPMVSGKKNDVLVECLQVIKAYFEADSTNKPIQIFKYQNTFQNGCTTHPNVEDHAKMAELLQPFFEELLGG